MRRVLVVDDNAVMRQLVRQLFETEHGFEVCGDAVDGADAIEKAIALKPQLIVMDSQMPIMSGWQAAPLSNTFRQWVIIMFSLHV